MTAEYKHSPLGIILIVGAAVAFIITAIFNGASGSFGRDSGIFLSSIGNLSDRYATEITPSGWAFSIWGFIYTWQALYLVYGITTIFRKCEDGYLYQAPPVVPIYTYGVYVINMMLNLTWIFCWDRQWVIASLVIIALMVFSLHVMLFCCYREFDKAAMALIKYGKSYEVWLVRIICHNAWAFYCGWISVATLLNLTIVMAYRGTVSVQDASTVSLSILTVELLLYFCLETFVFDRFLRYQFSQYIPVLIALIGGLTKNWQPNSRNSIFTAVLLGIAVCLSIAKLVIMIVRHKKSPLANQKVSESSTQVKGDEAKA
ncbi:uncharacterized protein LOC135497867 [Lineus longissimus]|uniref:uncharacterized protein LOC135497867 n=1 Tax=Lineus longissimus TaxID=88925 RepID=UPI00315C57AC